MSRLASFGSALLMGEQALRLLGNSEERARRVMQTFRQHDEASVEKMYQLWGDDHTYGLVLREQLNELEKVLQNDRSERLESESPEPEKNAE